MVAKLSLATQSIDPCFEFCYKGIIEGILGRHPSLSITYPRLKGVQCGHLYQIFKDFRPYTVSIAMRFGVQILVPCILAIDDFEHRADDEKCGYFKYPDFFV